MPCLCNATHAWLVRVNGIREPGRERTDEDAVEQDTHLEQHALHKRLRFHFLGVVVVIRRHRRCPIFGSLGRGERAVGVPDGAIDEVAAVVEVPAVAPVHLCKRELDGGHGEDAPHRDRAGQGGVPAEHGRVAETWVEERGECGREQVAECGPSVGGTSEAVAFPASGNGKRATDIRTPVPKCLTMNNAFCGTRRRSTRVAMRGKIAARVDTAMITNRAPTCSGLLYSS